MTTERTQVGREVEAALGEVLAHVRGETVLPCRIVDDPSAKHILALRKRMKLSRQKFADRFGLDVRAVQDWEQGRRVPDRAARVLLTVIDRDPEAVVRALGEFRKALYTRVPDSLGRKLSMARKCYVCGGDATSREHVPPRCFFPDDSKYRQQLITVRSCTKHNEDTSLDDEYVRNVIAMCIGNNSIGFKQFIEKTVKSFEDSTGLMKRTVGTSQTVLTPEGPTRAFQIDRARFNKVMKKIAYGLYFYEFQKPWDRDLIVATPNMKTQDMREDDYGPLMRWAEANCPPLPSQGKNPKVFQYQYLQGNENTEDTVFRIVFYENFVAWIVKLKDSQTFGI